MTPVIEAKLRIPTFSFVGTDPIQDHSGPHVYSMDRRGMDRNYQFRNLDWTLDQLAGKFIDSAHKCIPIYNFGHYMSFFLQNSSRRARWISHFGTMLMLLLGIFLSGTGFTLVMIFAGKPNSPLIKHLAVVSLTFLQIPVLMPTRAIVNTRAGEPTALAVGCQGSGGFRFPTARLAAQQILRLLRHWFLQTQKVWLDRGKSFGEDQIETWMQTVLFSQRKFCLVHFSLALKIKPRNWWPQDRTTRSVRRLLQRFCNQSRKVSDLCLFPGDQKAACPSKGKTLPAGYITASALIDRRSHHLGGSSKTIQGLAVSMLAS